MALKDWLTRLRGDEPKRDEAAPATPAPAPIEPPPMTSPPGQPPAPVPPQGPPTMLQHPVPGASPLQPVPPPFTAPPPLQRLDADPTGSVPAPESFPETADDAALRDAEADIERALHPQPRPGLLEQFRHRDAVPAPPSPAEEVAPFEIELPPDFDLPEEFASGEVAAEPVAGPEPPAPPPALQPASPAAFTPPPAPLPEAPPQAPGGFFGRLRSGLARSTQRLTGSITGLFQKRRLDEEALEELEDTLISADLGVGASRRIVESFRRTRFGREVTDEEVKEALAEEITAILEPVAQPMSIQPERKPHVVLVVGVNGTGKTTTIAKLGQQYREGGLSTMFAAGDTFRAAAVEQLQIWGERTGCPVVAPVKEGADAAGLAFDALKQAQAQGAQVLLMDTAGRLHNKSALMEELRKIVRVIRRLDETAPHSVLLVLDATTGQNAVQQARIFKEMVDVSGLAVTKLDGSAKGGVVVALAQEFGLPVHMVGVGEKAADLRPFTARDFARSLVGLD